VAGRTRESFRAGRAVCDGVHGRLRYELRLTWLGGMRILENLERADFNVFVARPELGTRDALSLVLQALSWDGS
jgi:phytoene/squalene synthetase